MKNKTKNIILGVSLGINILLALLVGGALVKSCSDGANKKAVAGYALNNTIVSSGYYLLPDEFGNLPDYAWDISLNFTCDAIPDYSFFGIHGVDYENQGIFNLDFAGTPYYFGVVEYNEWLNQDYRTIKVTTAQMVTFPSSGAETFWGGVTRLGDVTPEQSSSEQTSEQTSQSTSEVVSSSEETTEDLTSEQTSIATSEGQPVDSLPSGFTLRFGERNPFSAWAENPKNEDPATGYDSNAPFVLYTGTASSSTMGEVTAKYYRYEVGSFYVAGNPDVVYDTIAITTMNLSPDNYFLYNGGEEATVVGQEAYNKGAFIVANAYYLNSVTNTRVKVLSIGETTAKYGNTEIMALTNPSWSNVGFRDIVYIGDNPQIEINGYTARSSWWLENNALSSSAAVGSMLLGDATTGVFGLIGQAFTSIASIFGIALIPGLTIGTLLFIPLVVLIILAILRLLAK